LAAPTAESTADLFRQPNREFMLLVGKDGAGKSTAIVSLALFVQQILAPDAKFYVIDTENKFKTALKSFGADAPTNIVHYKAEDMNGVTEAFDAIMNKRKPGDWLAVESMARMWEKAQDLGYKAISGFGKAEYLEKRRAANRSAPVIPKPDDFWSIVKGAHDSAFLDIISQADTLNVVLTTTMSKAPREDSRFKENATRAAARAEFGLDMGLDGAPRLPTYVETLVLFDIKAGKGSCRIMRDNLSSLLLPRIEFDVEGRRDWAMTFWMKCRG
jgi:energy-coupling factor transporter ATP-binding protein EcfA2